VAVFFVFGGENKMSTPRSAYIPMPNWLIDYRKELLRPDVIAGVTAAAVVIPKAMAYATIAGLPVQVGLYTVFVPMLIYALLGTSRPLSVSTTTTLAILTGAEFAEVAVKGNSASLLAASAMLTLLVGSILVLAGLLRLGFVANFISEPVLIGFKAGIGIVIVVDQIPKLLGVHFEKGPFFFRNLFALLKSIPDTSMITLAVGIVMIVVLVAMEHYVPRAPAPLIAVALGILGVSALGLQSLGVQTVGNVPTGLPAFIRPDFSLAVQLWPGALGIALMSFTETIAAGRAFLKSGEPSPRPNQELLATGLATAGGALLGSMPAGGGTTQTAVNRLAGACTQMAELVTAGGALITMLFLAPLIARMPQATLAAIVIVYSIGLIKPAEFRAVRKIRRMEFRWAFIALLGVVLLGTLKGILVAIIASLAGLAYQVADPPVQALGRKRGTNVFRPLSKEHPDDETFPGLLLIRLEGRIFFANAARISQKMRLLVDEAKPKVIAVDFSGVIDLEYTALKTLVEAERKERERGVLLWLVGLNQEVLAVVMRSQLGEILGRERMFFNLEMAVAKYLDSPAD
jgi:sulfate permease, SulP family